MSGYFNAASNPASCTAHTLHTDASLNCHALGKPTVDGDSTTDNSCGDECDGTTQYLDTSANACANARECTDDSVQQLTGLSSVADRVCQCVAGYDTLNAAGTS